MAVLLLKILCCQVVRRLGEPGGRVALLSAADLLVAFNLRAPTRLCICSNSVSLVFFSPFYVLFILRQYLHYRQGRFKF